MLEVFEVAPFWLLPPYPTPLLLYALFDPAERLFILGLPNYHQELCMPTHRRNLGENNTVIYREWFILQKLAKRPQF